MIRICFKIRLIMEISVKSTISHPLSYKIKFTYCKKSG